MELLHLLEVEPGRGNVTGCPVGDGPALFGQEADPEHSHQVGLFEPDGSAVIRSVITHRVGGGTRASRARTRSNRNPKPRPTPCRLPGAVIQKRTPSGGAERLTTLKSALDHSASYTVRLVPLSG